MVQYQILYSDGWFVYEYAVFFFLGPTISGLVIEHLPFDYNN